MTLGPTKWRNPRASTALGFLRFSRLCALVGKNNPYCSSIAVLALDPIRDLSQVLKFDVLIISELFLVGVADEGQLIFFGSLRALEQRGEGVTAGVRGIGVLLLAVDVKRGILQAQ